MKTLSLSWQNPVRISCQLCQQISVLWASLHLSGISSDPRCHWTLLGLVSGISTYQTNGFLLCLWLTPSVTFLEVQMTKRKASQSNRRGCVLGSHATQSWLLLLREGGQGHPIEKKKKKKTHCLLTHLAPFQVRKEKKRGDGSKVGRISGPLCQCPIAIQPKFEHQFPSLWAVFKGLWFGSCGSISSLPLLPLLGGVVCSFIWETTSVSTFVRKVLLYPDTKWQF